VIAPVRIGHAPLLAMSTAERSPQFPDIPTVAETVPGFTMTGWHAYFAPAGTPRPIIEHLSKTLAVVSRDPAIVKTLGSLGIDAVNATRDQLAQNHSGGYSVVQGSARCGRPAAHTNREMTLDEARRLTMTMVSRGDAATAATPEFVPLSKHIGCEVKGIDLRKPLRPDTISAIY